MPHPVGDPVTGWLQAVGVPQEDLREARLAALGAAATFVPVGCAACEAKQVELVAELHAGRITGQQHGELLEAASRACLRCTAMAELGPRAASDPRSDEYERRLAELVRVLYPEFHREAPDEVEAKRRATFVERQKVAIRAGARILFTCDRGSIQAYVVTRERRPAEDESYHHEEDHWAAYRVGAERRAALSASLDAFLDADGQPLSQFHPGHEAASFDEDDGEEAGEPAEGAVPPWDAELEARRAAQAQAAVERDAARLAQGPSMEELLAHANVTTFKSAVAGGLRWLLGKVEDPTFRQAQAQAVQVLGEVVPGWSRRAQRAAEGDDAGSVIRLFPGVIHPEELVAGEAAAREAAKRGPRAAPKAPSRPAAVGAQAGPPGYRQLPDGSMIRLGWRIDWDLAGAAGEAGASGVFLRTQDRHVVPFDAYGKLVDAPPTDEAGFAVWLPAGVVGGPPGPVAGGWHEDGPTTPMAAPVDLAAAHAPPAETF